MTQRGAVWFIVALMGVLLSGCGLMRPSEEMRYRLTVEVETPQGLCTGSSVIEVRAVRNPDWVNPEGRGTRSSFRGEAAAIDLPGGKTLFALPEGEDGGGSDAMNYPWLAFEGRLKNSKDIFEDFRHMRQWKNEVVEMPKYHIIDDYENGKPIHNMAPGYPMLVTFGDINDPKSVAHIDPAALDKHFGAGVRLRRITLEVTDDAVTTGIEKRLVWLGKYFNKTFAGNRYAVDNSLPDSLTAGSFTTMKSK